MNYEIVASPSMVSPGTVDVSVRANSEAEASYKRMDNRGTVQRRVSKEQNG